MNPLICNKAALHAAAAREGRVATPCSVHGCGAPATCRYNGVPYCGPHYAAACPSVAAPPLPEGACGSCGEAECEDRQGCWEGQDVRQMRPHWRALGRRR
jgi:hypothetical protein